MRGAWTRRIFSRLSTTSTLHFAKDPKFALAYTGLADASLRMYGERKDSFWTEKALNAAKQAQALNDGLPEVHFSLGSVYAATGQMTQAIVELKRAQDLAPNSDEGYRRLGNCVYVRGEGCAGHSRAGRGG